MLARWWIVVTLGCAGSTATKSDVPRNATKATAATARHTVVEGHVRNAQTGATVPGIEVDAWLGARHHGRVSAWVISDENGFFRLEVEPGTGFLFTSLGELDAAPSLVFRPGTRIGIDVTVDPNELAQWRAMNPPEACPSSPPGTIIEGHTTTQQDLDDIARTVLERSAVDSSAIPDLGIAARGSVPIAVRVDVRTGKQLTARALPPSGFVLKTLEELQKQADRLDRDVGYVELSQLYSNGSCAVVDVGGDFVSPSRQSFGKLCCCTARDIYEKRGARWIFVRRVSEICA